MLSYFVILLQWTQSFFSVNLLFCQLFCYTELNHFCYSIQLFCDLISPFYYTELSYFCYSTQSFVDCYSEHPYLIATVLIHFLIPGVLSHFFIAAVLSHFFIPTTLSHFLLL
jgi:hypothetical protein